MSCSMFGCVIILLVYFSFNMLSKRTQSNMEYEIFISQNI